MRQICSKEKCTGCHACVNICPQNSIEMVADEFGFLYPVINQETCVNCGICKRQCPVLQSRPIVESIKVYAAINKTPFDYETTTSGGIATLFARKILKQGGVVYGAAVCEDLSVKHIRVTSDKDVEQIKGSKYVQSKIGETFTEAKRDLEEGKVVLFIGTPCQIAGLKKVVGEKYDKLITCDIVCHGVPSPQYLNEHIESIGNYSGVNCLSFRDKEGYYLTLFRNTEICYRKRNFLDLYCLGFLKGLLQRDSCFNCEFANSNRIGDITLGDFWGFDSNQGAFPVAHENGLSLVMINTKKGNEVFENCAKDMVFIERALEEAIMGNKQLRHASSRHKNYYQFRKNYLKVGFKKASKKALWKERVIYSILHRLGK